jgi:ABC-type transporter Mla MlaB component
MSNKDYKLKIIPSKNKKDRKAEVIIEKELTISVLESMQTELTGVLNEFENIEIKLKNIETIDLGFIQYLYAFQSTAETRSKNVTLKAECNDETENLLVNTGIYRLFN